jgi:hypothetical protein
LGTEWRARRWRKLLNLIDGLPRDSAYVEALTSDEQWAAAVLDNPPPDGPPTRRMADWTPELEMLTNLYDRVGELIQVTVATAGGKPRKVQPAPRPTTALERARRHRREAKHRSLVSRVLPHRASVTSAPVGDPPAVRRAAGPGTEWLRRRHEQGGA